MFCNNCGKEISDEAIVCVNCGAPTGRPIPGQQQVVQQAPKVQVDPNEPANGGLVALSIFVPAAGIALGIVNLTTGHKRAGKTYLTCGIVSTAVITTLCVIFYLIFVFSMMNF